MASWLTLIAIACATAPLLGLTAVYLIRILFFRRYSEPGKATVAFFHPYWCVRFVVTDSICVRSKGLRGL